MTSPSTTPDPKNYIASVEKAVRVLELFADGPPQLTLAEIVRRTGYSRTAAYRLITTLEQLEWIARHGDKYQLSLRIFRVGAAAINALQLRQEAGQSLSELAATTGETIYLLVPDNKRGVCLERIEGSSQVQIMVLNVGQSLPLFCGGGPLAILSYRDDLLNQLAPDAPLQCPGGKTLSMEHLQTILGETRVRGYSRSMEDVTPGVAAFGAPVFDAGGQVIAAISIGGLVQTLTRQEDMFSRALVTAASDISKRLGYQGAP